MTHGSLCDVRVPRLEGIVAIKAQRFLGQEIALAKQVHRAFGNRGTGQNTAVLGSLLQRKDVLGPRCFSVLDRRRFVNNDQIIWVLVEKRLRNFRATGRRESFYIYNEDF